VRFPGIPDLPDPRREGWGPFFKAFVLREDGRLRQGWRILGFLLALFLASLLVSAPVGLFFLGRSVPVWFPSLVAGLVCLLVSWGFLGVEGRPLATLGLWMTRRWVLQALAGLLAGFLLVLLPAAGLRSLGIYQWNPVEGRLPVLLVQGVLLAVATGFYEELLARGYLFQRLIAGLGPWPAQGLVALVWLLLHGHAPGLPWPARLLDLLNVVLASLLLGQAWLRTRSLALPMGLHAGWVFAQGTLLGFPVGGVISPALLVPVAREGAPVWLSGMAGGLESTLPTTAAFALAFLLLLPWKRSAPPTTQGWEDTTRIF